MKDTTRRSFIKNAGLGAVAFGVAGSSLAAEKPIQGFDNSIRKADTSETWKPTSDRKIRVGIAGHGCCKFGAAFGLQDHPNVEVVAVTDLFPDRCAEMAKACRCEKTYPSLEEMVKDDSIEAIYCATDAPSHAKHAMMVLEHGKHVAVAVPATFNSLEDGEKLFETFKKNRGLQYMMYETSAFHEDLYAMRQLYRAGRFGKMIYTEGEYFHYCPTPIESYGGWRVGTPPQLYPTHSNAYYNVVTDGSFTEVSCMGMPSIVPHLMPKNNPYHNAFGTEIALLRTSEGGMARIAISWDTPGKSGEMGRARGQKGSFYGKPEKLDVEGVEQRRPALPPQMELTRNHGGSHPYLTHEFISSILEDRKPMIDIALALNMTVAGIVAHHSAMKDGETLKIPQYTYPA